MSLRATCFYEVLAKQSQFQKQVYKLKINMVENEIESRAESGLDYQLPERIVEICEQLQKEHPDLEETITKLKAEIEKEKMSEGAGLGFLSGVFRNEFKKFGVDTKIFDQEPKMRDLLAAIGELVGAEVVEEIYQMDDFEEALGYAFTLLAEQGEDPEEFLREKGILE